MELVMTIPFPPPGLSIGQQNHGAINLGRSIPIRWIPAIAMICLFLAGCGVKNTAGNGALAPIPAGSVGVYFFWGDGCPHCAQAKPFFEALARRNPRVVLRSYEVWYHKDYQEILQAM